MQVVMSKLRQQAVLEHDRRHYKAAKVSHMMFITVFTTHYRL